uniref:Uncharacterized protein n=1 Tax=Cucumis melo TaxID=3656 RepID=A0A9I9EI74_CUCME
MRKFFSIFNSFCFLLCCQNCFNFLCPQESLSFLSI